MKKLSPVLELAISSTGCFHYSTFLPTALNSSLWTHERLSRVSTSDRVYTADIRPFAELWKCLERNLCVREVSIGEIFRIQDAGRKVGTRGHRILQDAFIHTRIFQRRAAQVCIRKVCLDEASRCQK